MISSKKLIKITKNWQKLAAFKRKGFELLPSPTNKGRFVIYTTDKKRFKIPLENLNNGIFSELLKLFEEQFGFPADGPFTLPCGSQIMEYITLLIARGGASKDLEKVLLSSVASNNCSISSLSHEEQEMQQLFVCTC